MVERPHHRRIAAVLQALWARIKALAPIARAKRMRYVPYWA